MNTSKRQVSMQDRSVCVLFSGGQDSSIVLLWALAHFREVTTLGFAYAQRHLVEMEARAALLARIRAEHSLCDRLKGDRIIDTDLWRGLSTSALIAPGPISVMAKDGYAASFLPGRNLLFLLLAAVALYEGPTRDIAAGMCENDASGYPDCRRAALAGQMEAIRVGLDAPFMLHTPLLELDKARSWQLLEEQDGRIWVEHVMQLSHSCYEGERGIRHFWGYGCGRCGACRLRKEGVENYRSIAAARP